MLVRFGAELLGFRGLVFGSFLGWLLLVLDWLVHVSFF